MMTAILKSAILIQPFSIKKIHSFILTQLDDGSYLEFCHVGLSHLSFSSQTHLHLPRLVPNICTKKIHSFILTQTWWWQLSWTLPSWIQPFSTKKPWLIHSDSTWWWQPSWILPCWIQILPSWIQTPCYLFLDLLKNTLIPFWLWLKLIQSDSNSFILT